jgi:hypothetical protein
MKKKWKKSKLTQLTKYLFRGITIEKKMEFVDKVKKLTNEGLTKMVEHIQGLLP